MNLDTSTGTVFDRIALACGVISVCIGGLGLIGWTMGSRVLTGGRGDHDYDTTAERHPHYRV